jgi:hypothetical protein
VRRGSFLQVRHPGEGRDLTIASECIGEIPAFAGMTEVGLSGDV